MNRMNARVLNMIYDDHLQEIIFKSQSKSGVVEKVISKNGDAFSENGTAFSEDKAAK